MPRWHEDHHTLTLAIGNILEDVREDLAMPIPSIARTDLGYKFTERHRSIDFAG
jgi:hypothetical protein